MATVVACECYLASLDTCTLSCDTWVPVELTLFSLALFAAAGLLIRQLNVAFSSTAMAMSYVLLLLSALTRVLRGVFLLTGDAVPGEPLYGVMSGLPFVLLLGTLGAIVAAWAVLGHRTDAKAFQSPSTIIAIVATVFALFFTVAVINLVLVYPLAGDLTADSLLAGTVSFSACFMLYAMMSYASSFRSVFSETSRAGNAAAYAKMTRVSQLSPLVLGTCILLGLVPLVLQVAGVSDLSGLAVAFVILARISELGIHALVWVVLYLEVSAKQLKSRRLSRSDMSALIRNAPPENLSSGRASRGSRAGKSSNADDPDEDPGSKVLLETGGDLSKILGKLRESQPQLVPATAAAVTTGAAPAALDASGVGAARRSISISSVEGGPVRVKLSVAGDGSVRLSLRVRSGAGSARRRSSASQHRSDSKSRRRRSSSGKA